MISNIQTAYTQRDIQTLKKFAIAKTRKINKRSDFKSVLMLSCNNIKHLSKIESTDADCIMLNLEDGVSEEDKPFALVLAAVFISKIQESDKKLVVRVNALNNGGYEEIKYLNKFMPDAIRVPKIENREDVIGILDILDEKIELHLSIETASAWNNLQTLSVDSRVTTFYLGILDLFADLKLPQSLVDLNNPTMHYMLCHFLITSKTIGVKPVSFVFQEYKNLDLFQKWLELEKRIGYDAKGCISPSQVEFVNKIFQNKKEELDRARKIIHLFETNRKKGITGFVDEKYGFIDEPIYKDALNIIKKY